MPTLNIASFNTHLDNKGTVAREQSVTLILKRIRTIAGTTPFFLTGDFNLRPGTPGINRLSTLPSRHGDTTCGA